MVFLRSAPNLRQACIYETRFVGQPWRISGLGGTKPLMQFSSFETHRRLHPDSSQDRVYAFETTWHGTVKEKFQP